MREKETVLDGAKEREIGLQICVNFCENKSQKVIGWNLGQSEKHQASSSSEQKNVSPANQVSCECTLYAKGETMENCVCKRVILKTRRK